MPPGRTCWRGPGRSPRSPSGPRTPARPSGGCWGSCGSRTHRRSAGCWPASTRTRWTQPSGLGRRGDHAGRGCRRRIAVDGKTLRGSRQGDAPGQHLLAAFDQQHHVVLAQRGVDAKTNEIPDLKALLGGVDLAGAVVTAAALHTQRDTATWLVQPALSAQLTALPWNRVATRATTGPWRTDCTGSATSPTTRTTTVPAPVTHPRSWPASATSRSASCACPAPPTSPKHYATTPANPNDHSPRS